MDTLKKSLEQREKPELIAIITHMLRQEPDNDYRNEYVAFSVILMGCIDGLDSCFAGEEDNPELRLRILRTPLRHLPLLYR